MRSYKMNLIGLACSATCLLGACSVGKTDETETSSELLAHIVEYANEKEVSVGEVEQQLAALTWNAENISKGGAGFVGHGVYVDTSAMNNVISVDGARWTGLNADTVQVVFVAGDRVISDADVTHPDEAILVIFTPTHIRFFDLKNNRAGKYRRADLTEE